MSWDPTATLLKLQSTIAAAVTFPGGVVIGEPFSPPLDLTAAIMLESFDPARTTLTGTIDVWEVSVRLYSKAGMTAADAQSVELALAKGFSQVAAALAGAFTLGGTIRAIDWAGEEAGRSVSAKWGHLTIGGTILRCVELTIPLIVDDSGIFSP